MRFSFNDSPFKSQHRPFTSYRSLYSVVHKTKFICLSCAQQGRAICHDKQKGLTTGHKAKGRKESQMSKNLVRCLCMARQCLTAKSIL